MPQGAPAAELSTLATAAENAVRHELVLIDGNVADRDSLLADLRASAGPDRELEVLVLDAGRDGIGQITDILRERSGLDAVHVIAHGSDGVLQLGSTRLESESLAARRDAVASWGDALSSDADLLLYGCDLAGGERGEALLQGLAELTGADVAASTDVTGSALYGADWELEATVGHVEASALSSRWAGALSIENVADDLASGGYAGNTGSESWSTPWREIGELTDPSGGVVDVNGGAIRMGGAGNDLTDHGIVREADLDGVLYATLRFDYRRQNQMGSGGSVSAQVSTDGSTWTTLATYALGPTDPGYVAQSFDISAYTGPETRVRFLGSGNASGYFNVDNVEIQYSRTLYLKGDGVPAASLSTAVPVNVALPNYDPARDASAGLVLKKGGSGLGETDADQQQTWLAPVDGVNAIDARVQLTFFSAMKDFEAGKRGHVTAYLMDVSGTTQTQIATASLQADDWGGGGWQQFTLDFGDQSYDLAAGHRLGVKLIVENNSQGDLWFAYDTGTYASKLTFLASTPSESAGAALFSDGTAVPSASQWDGTSFGAAGATANMSSRWRIVQGAEAPTRDEKIVIGVDTSGTVRGEIWNGTTWSALPTNPLATGTTSTYWAGEVAYESTSGDALVVWSNGTTGSAGLSYSVWNGTTWTAPQTIATPLAGQAQQLRLAASPDSDEMVLIVSNASSQDYALVWNGSSWGNGISLSATGTGNDRTDVFVAYEQQSGDAMVVYGKGTGSVFYRTWNGTAWSSESSLANPAGATGNARWTTLGSDPNSDRIALGVLTYNNGVWLSVWDGSSWQTPVVATTNASSATAMGVAVAFESTTGQALATYTASGSAYTRYRTWSSASGWSSEAIGTYVGQTPQGLTLDADPMTDDIMLGIVDDGSDINFARWNGAGWSERTELENNNGEGAYQPFVFMWDRGLNTPPTVTLPGGAVSYTENGPAVVLDGAAIVADPDSPTLTGGELTVSISANATAADRLAIRNQGAGIGNVSVSGSTILYDFGSGPTAIGSYTGGGNGTTPLTVTFNASATLTAVQAVVRNVTFSNVSDGPSTLARTVSLTLADGEGGTSTAVTKTVTVIALPDPPVLGDASFTLAENTAAGTVVTTLAATDPDAGETFTYAILGGNTGGAFALDATTGALTVAVPAALNFETTPTFTLTVRVTDSGGLTDNATITVNLTNVNEAPVLNDATFALAENSAAGTAVATLAATDPDAGSTFTYAILGGNTNGAFALDATTGALTVANPAALNFETTPTFTLTVRVTDSGGLTDNATITVNLTNVNEAPVLNDAAFSVAENSAAGTAVATLAATDPDAGSTFTYSILSGNTGGAFALDPTTGQITVANPAALDFETTPSFTLTVQVTDAGGLTDNATITVNLTNVNEAPVLNDAAFSVAENSAAGTAVATLAATDPDAGSIFTYSILGGNTNGAFALDPTTGQITVANPAALDFETTPTFTLTVQVTDAGGLTDTATITVDLTDANEVPDLADATFALAENSAAGTAVATLAATDPDAGSTFTYSILSGNTGGAFALDPTTGEITVANTSALDFETTPSFTLTVQVTDAGGLTDTATITVDLTDANEVPDLADAVFALAENNAAGSVVGSVAATDPDAGETFTYAILGGNTNGAFALDPTTGALTVANPAALNFETTPSFTLTVQVTDAGGLTDNATITLNLTNVNEAPVLNDAAFSVAENSAAGTAVATLAATDPDAGSTFTYAILAGNTNGAFALDATAGALTVANPAALDLETTPSFTLTVQVTDAGGLTDNATITVNLTNVNEAPILNDAAFSLAENSAAGTAVATLAATDPDAGSTFTYAILGGNTNGAFALDPTTGALTVANPAALNFETTPSFTLTVQVTDAGGLTDNATITVNLTNVNEAPVLNDAPFSVAENSAAGSVVGSVIATDPDAGETFTYAILGGNTNGAFALDATTGALTVANAAALDLETTPTFTLTVQVTDAGGLTDTATITVNLTDANEVPDLADAVFALAENSAAGSVVGGVAATDPDAGETFSYAILGGNTNGAFALNAATGELTVANPAALDFETTPTFTLTVQVTDAGGLTDNATITVDLTNVNEAPVLNDAAFSLAENSAAGAAVATLAATDPDAGSTFTYAILSGNTGGAFALDPTTGQITVANPAALDFETTPTFTLTVQVTDAGGLTDNATITVNLTNVNEAPVLNDAAFSLAENSAAGAVVGSVAATDPDAGSTFTYSILAGNTNGAFALNVATGELTVANPAALDFETTPSFTLSVQVTDGGGLADTATITVDLTNANEAPSLTGVSFAIDENSIAGTWVGSLAATDPDAGETF
ncbi:MAG TPA: cadherin domain-containing protein, partial [Myxococcota bacterium]|nr:cadherin domain-containing protein [Myxococcota bacterium]